MIGFWVSEWMTSSLFKDNMHIQEMNGVGGRANLYASGINQIQTSLSNAKTLA